MDSDDECRLIAALARLVSLAAEQHDEPASWRGRHATNQHLVDLCVCVRIDWVGDLLPACCRAFKQALQHA